jgi:ABC-2 type transport system permease protein
MNLRSLGQLVVTQATIIRRNTAYWASSIILAVISMAVFGLLFNPNVDAFDLAVVDEDGTEASRLLVAGFEPIESVKLREGDREEELRALKEGDRGAVLIVPDGFERRLSAGEMSLPVFYDASNPVQTGYVTSTVQAVVSGYNEEVLGDTKALSLDEQTVDSQGGRFVDFLTPGMVGMTVMWVNLGVGFLMVSWREQGILRRLAVTPLRPGVLIGSQAVSFAIMSAVQVTIILTMGAVIFGVQVTGSFLWLAVTVLLGVLAMLSMGYVIASVLKTVTSVNAVVNLVAFPSIFLGGSYFQLSTPAGLAPLVEALPLTHLNRALREVVNHGGELSDLWVSWAALAACIAGGFLVSMRLFRWQ